MWPCAMKLFMGAMKTNHQAQNGVTRAKPHRDFIPDCISSLSQEQNFRPAWNFLVSAGEAAWLISSPALPQREGILARNNPLSLHFLVPLSPPINLSFCTAPGSSFLLAKWVLPDS